MKSNKLVQIILIFLVALIWGGVFFRTFSILNQNDKINIENKNDSPIYDSKIIKNKLKKLNINFNQKTTDPFRSFSISKIFYKKKSASLKVKTKIITPAYLLKGIVWDETNPQAILIKSKIYDKNSKLKIGETVIVSKNNSIDYGKVLDISENYVIIKTYNYKFKLWSNLWKKID